MSTGSIIGAISTVIGGALAGWFGWLAKRAQAHGPESVAGGYSRLVKDMQSQQEALLQRVAELESRLALVTTQVNWLLRQVTPEQRDEFELRFAGPREGER